MAVTNEYFVAPLDIYPYQTVPPFAQFEVFGASSMLNNMEAPRWALYTMYDMWYDPDVKGLILAPNQGAFADMELANFSANAANFSTCNPFDAPYDYLYCFYGPVNTVTTATYSGSLPANPWFSLDFWRWGVPSGQTLTNSKWQLNFGSGWSLVWGLAQCPQVLYENQLVSQLTFASCDSGSYYTADRMQFGIKVVPPYLYITCNAFPGGTWKVPLVASGNVMASGGYSIAGGGGQWMMNLTPMTFATTGTAITPWIETFTAHNDIPASAGGSFLGIPYPGPLVETGGIYYYPALMNTTVTIAPYATNGTRKQFILTMTGSGAATDVVQSMSLEYMPVFSSESYGSWVDITPWVESATENFSEKGARSTEVTLRPGIIYQGTQFPSYVGRTLAGVAGSIMQGQFAFKYQIYPDPALTAASALAAGGAIGVSGNQRMAGIMTGNLDKRAVGKADVLTLTAFDKWKQLDDTEVIFPASCLNMNLGDAIGKIAQWGGIAPDYILLQSGVNGITLNDPSIDYASPPWMIAKGATCGEFIKHLAQTFNLLVEFNADGWLSVGLQPPYVATIAGTYSYAPGADPLYAIENLEDEIDLTGVKNIVLLECKDEYGNPVILSMIDSEALTPPSTLSNPDLVVAGPDRFLGYYSFEYHNVPDVTSATNINLALAGLFAQASRGWRKVRFSSHTSGILSLFAWPGQRITLYDPAKLGTVLVTITNIKQTLSLRHGNVPEIRGEIRGA